MSSRSNLSKMGKHIAELRKSKGYTQKTLGDILDISDKTVSKWEKGVVAPDITILNSLASTLDISIEELLAGEELTKPNTLEAIDIYSKLTKKKLLKTFAVFALLFILCTFLVFRIEDYYSWHLIPIYSKDLISTKGYILNNNKESKITIYDFNIQRIDDSKTIKSINIKLLNKDSVIYDDTKNYDDKILYHDILNNFTLYVETKEIVEFKNLKLMAVIEYIDGDIKTITATY